MKKMKLAEIKLSSFVTDLNGKAKGVQGGITANPRCAGPGTQDPSLPICSEQCTVEDTWQITCGTTCCPY